MSDPTEKTGHNWIPAILMRENRRQLKGFALAFAGMVLLACNYITAKTALEAFNPVTFSVLWYVFATAYSLILICLMGQVSQLRLSGKDFRMMMLLGLTLTGSAALGWAALKLMDPTFSAFLGRLTPVMAILLGVVMLKETIRTQEWMCVLVMVAGGALSTMGGTWRAEWLGITLTLLASLFTALQFTIGKLGGSNIQPLVMNVYRTGVAGTLFILWCVFMGGFDLTVAQPRHWYAIFLGALLGPCLSVTLLYASYRYWDLSRTAMVLTLQPLAVMPMAYILFQTFPGGWKLVGGLLIMVGALWLVVIKDRPSGKLLAITPAKAESTEDTPSPCGVPLK
jgi:drug/metabolite transporter (DMT)-like permease